MAFASTGLEVPPLTPLAPRTLCGWVGVRDKVTTLAENNVQTTYRVSRIQLQAVCRLGPKESSSGWARTNENGQVRKNNPVK